MEHSYMMNAEEVAKMLEISKAHAYKIIRQFNEELEQQGYLTVAGKVPRTFLEKKFYGFTA